MRSTFSISVEPNGDSLRSAATAAFISGAAGRQNFLRHRPRFQIGGEQLHAIVRIELREARFERGQCRFAKHAGLAGRRIEQDHDVARLRLLRSVGRRRDAEREECLAIFASEGCQFGRRLFRVGCVRRNARLR